ncbi:hypothetical protein ACP87_03200 [Pseudomonas oleovorans]|nr:hypothetical protein [Pseudomonas oleovorans]MBN7131164.1 hypothetical protein [Pseudomonas oleovorans]MBN7140380.1 hypothetical protein [Pseudomonas oleovorans]
MLLHALQQSSFPASRIFVYIQKWAALLSLLQAQKPFETQFSENIESAIQPTQKLSSFFVYGTTTKTVHQASNN